MNKLITKTLYLLYLECPKNAWLKLHKPELANLFELSDFEKSLLDKGNFVECFARKKFPDGILIKGELGIHSSLDLTQKYILDKKPVIFQATFIFDKFLIRSDILEYDKTYDQYNIYEIKGKNSLDENKYEIDHIEDVTFQSFIIQNLGINLGKLFIIHLNKDYKKKDDININELFIQENITERVERRLKTTKLKIEGIKKSLFQENEDLLFCGCIYKGRSAHCSTFKYSHNYVPPYSVHDITRIGNSKKKLANLIDKKIFKIEDIPKGFKLSSIQQKQIDSHLLKKSFVLFDLIESELNKLQYPLYFLDYESYAPAIPIFNDFRPYQQIPFQFSLHVIKDRDSEPIHFEYLHEINLDPSLIIIQKLLEFIGNKGNIIVWHKSFEERINNELIERHPEYKEEINNINYRIYDLENIFKKQMYVHPEFKGKTSIKSILPVLAPELSYKNLNIQEGGEASSKWYEMVYGNLASEEKNKISQDLRRYCALDTFGMYKIWKALRDASK